MREYFKKALRRLPLLAATLSAAALIVAMPSVSAAGVKKGLLICASSAVPSLYPFCVLSAFFVRSGLCGYLGKFLEKPVRVLFALPGSAGAAACMSFVAGYPVGTGMTAALFSDGRISQSDAQRMTLFCVNAGPAFVIGGVGAGMLGSVRAGVIIFVSLTLASLTLGVLTRFIPHDETNKHAAPAISSLPLSRALTEAVAEGTKNMISICAWIVMFACAAQYIPLLRLPDWANLLLGCTLEDHRRMCLGSRGVQYPRHSGGARLGRSERTLPDNAAHKDLRDAAAVFFLRAPCLRRSRRAVLRGTAPPVPLSRKHRFAGFGRRSADVLFLRARRVCHAFERRDADIGA